MFPRMVSRLGRYFDLQALIHHCTMCCLCSMFSFQPNKLRRIYVLIYHSTYTYLSQLVRLEGKLCFQGNRDFQTLNLGFPFILTDFDCSKKQCFQCRKMKSETSFQVFFLKKHRKIASKILFSHEKVFLRLQPKYHRAIVLHKQHILHW